MQEQLLHREARLRESGQQLGAVLGGMTEGVMAVDPERRIMFVNRAAAALLSVDAEEAVGQRMRQAVRHHRLDELVETLSQQPGSKSLEFEWEQRILAINGTSLPGEPSPGIVLVFHDVTELRRLESLRQEFVANVSHELKTPLSAIKAYAETLENGAIDDPQHNRRFVQRIEEQADRLHELIQDMLSLARIESGRQTFQIGAVNAGGIIRACLSEHQATADARKVDLKGPRTADVSVRADANGLRQILDNLIDNAIKYTPAGGNVEVRCRREEEFALLEVSDTGIGIPAEHHDRLFERFFRVDQARSREMGGTGLGLAIVKHLAQSFDGQVDVDSEPGEGSTFRVRLPLA